MELLMLENMELLMLEGKGGVLAGRGSVLAGAVCLQGAAVCLGGGERSYELTYVRHFVSVSTYTYPRATVDVLALLTWIAISTASELRITTPPRSQTVLNNKRLKLPCKAQGGDLPIRIKWFKDGEFMYKIGQNYRISDRSGTLRFTRVTVFDRGEYQCKATNGFDLVESDPAQLNVHAEATLIHFPQQELVRPFSVLTAMTCEAAGIPLPSIQWRVDGASNYVDIKREKT
ncbi:hypothetical protein ACOMHN_013515 [Nucella lapillus]